MKFGALSNINLFWILALLAIFFIISERSRVLRLLKFAEANLADKLTASLNRKRRRLKFVLLFLSISLILLSLLRPQWGFHWEEVKLQGLDILIALDTSKSMLAKDVKPNRLERSKLAVKDLIKKLRGDRIGLIAFSGSAFLQCPLTVDYNGFMLALNDLSIYTIPKGGTSISSAIQSAITTFNDIKTDNKILVIITDGEDHEGNVINLAKEAGKRGISIFCIGLGTDEGEIIPVKDEFGRIRYLKNDEGNYVKTRLNENILKEIALQTGGIYIRSTGAEFGLDKIYQERLSKMEKRDIQTKMKKKFKERFQIPLSFALLLLLLEFLTSERKNEKK